LSALLVSGCVDPGAERVASVTQDAEVAPPKTEAHTQKEPAPEQSASLPPKPLPRALPKLDPKELIGLDKAAITALIGKPGFLRIDPPAELWRYRQAGCILDIFLYATGGNSEPKRAKHIEARSRTGQPLPMTPCLDAIRKAHADHPTG
jgi:hypothetical protein